MPEFVDPYEPHSQSMLPEDPNGRTVAIVAESGDDEGRRWIINKPVFVIGAAEDCDLRIENSHLGKYHAYIFLRDHVVTLRQLGPAPVVTVNGRLMRWGELQNGDLLMLGSTQVRVELKAGSTSNHQPVGGMSNQGLVDGIQAVSGPARFSFPTQDGSELS